MAVQEKDVEKLNDNARLTWKSMSVGQKYKHVINNITVEPILACYIMPSVLAGLATQNLNLEKACRSNLEYSDVVCDALAARNIANYTTEETQVQRLVAGMTVWKSIIQCSLPGLLIMFMGSWSDRRGLRKPCLLLPIIGEFCTSIGLLFCAYYMKELPMEVAGLTEAIFPALAGGWMTMFMAIFSYIADVTTIKMRTFRIGIVNIFVSLGIPVGTALSGILYQKIGFYGMYTLTSVLLAMGFAYGVMFLKEVRKPTPREPGIGFLRDFFDLKHVSETFKVAFRARENNRRIRVILLMILSVVMVGPMFGELTVTYLFTRYRFHWNEVDFSLYATYSVIVHLVGTVIGIGLFSHVLKMDDSLIGALACVGKIASSFVHGFSNSGFMFYMGVLLDLLNSSGLIAMRSMASKIVPTDEQGKINSLIGVCESMAPLVYSPLYSIVYSRSIQTMPGSFYFLGSGLLVPALLIYLWIYQLQRKEAQQAMCEQSSELEKSNKETNGGPYVNHAFETFGEK